MNPRCHHKYFYERETEEDFSTEEMRQGGYGGRNWSDVATNHISECWQH